MVIISSNDVEKYKQQFKEYWQGIELSLHSVFFDKTIKQEVGMNDSRIEDEMTKTYQNAFNRGMKKALRHDFVHQNTTRKLTEIACKNCSAPIDSTKNNFECQFCGTMYRVEQEETITVSELYNANLISRDKAKELLGLSDVDL